MITASSRPRRRQANVAAVLLLVLALLSVGPASSQAPRLLVPGDIMLPSGFGIEAAVTGLDAPTMVAFDDDGRMLIAESGYGGSGGPKVTRIEENGSKTVLVQGDPLDVPLTAIAFDNGTLYVVDANTVFRMRGEGPLEVLIDDLPGLGDHQANQVVIRNGTLYVGVGTVTNSAVVGYDNWVFGWLRMPERRNLTDVPCEDITLRGQRFPSQDPINGGENESSAYAPFGTTYEAGHVVKGDVRCNGAILALDLSVLPTGAIPEVLPEDSLRVVAWGLRNPYGLEVGPDGALYATNHGFDARGSRPIENAWDCFYRIEDGAWYGFPDYACEVPVTDARFRTPNKPQAEFLLQDHPGTPPAPIAKFDSHAAANGFAFSPGGDWGPTTDAFIALFGDMAPATGTVPEPQGFKVVRVDGTTGELVDFAANAINGRASRFGGGGFEHPSDVTFGPDGAMYVTDWGIADITGEGVKVREGSGVVWKIHRTDGPAGRGIDAEGTGPINANALGPTFALWTLLTIGLFAAAVALGWGGERFIRARAGALWGAIGGVAMGVAAMIVGVLVFSLPWFVAPRILAAMVMGRRAQANILEFDAPSFFVGLILLLALTTVLGLAFAWTARRREPLRVILGAAAWSLAWWALLQFIVWPLFFPLVNDKGFPPGWFGAAFLVFGITLGLGLAFGPRVIVAGRSRTEAESHHGGAT